MNEKSLTNSFKQTSKELKEMNLKVINNIENIIKYLNESKVLDINIEKIIDTYYKRDNFIGYKEEYKNFLRDTLQKFLDNIYKTREIGKTSEGVNQMFLSEEYWEEFHKYSKIEENYNKLIYFGLTINPFEQRKLMENTGNVS
ncbi:hypothetical protein KAZ01_03975, partial [Candidatus Gracilibacteria bacterium]|nr:hypothetical protein [Candidatus Gracilibacteria bacterium]